MRALNVLLSFAVSAVLAVLVFEVGLRLFPVYRPAQSLNRFDPKLGWVKKPGAVVRRQTPELDVTFEINALGLRDDPMSSTEKAPNTFRVMMLGDSFVLGYTVDRKYLFVDLLEHWWTEEKRRVDVINAGTEGYSTDQEVLWFLEQGVDFDPDLVLLFPYENDIYWNGQVDYHGKPKPRFRPDGSLETGTLADTTGKPSALANLAIGRFLDLNLKPWMNRLKHGPPGPGPYDFVAAQDEKGGDIWFSKEFAPLLKQPPDFLGDCMARTEGALKALKAKCAENGAELVMVPIPSEMSIHPEEREKFRTWAQGLKDLPDDLWSPDRPVNLFLDMARDLDIRSLDPRSALRAYVEASGGKRLYFPGQEWHFNELGNEIFARYLFNELGNLGVFPAEHGALVQIEPVLPEHPAGTPTWIKVFAALWVVLGAAYALTYRDEAAWLGFLKVGGLLAVVFAIVLGGGWALAKVPPHLSPWILLTFVTAILVFVIWKLGRRVGTILELLRSFTLRGHWYLMPLVVVLMTIGSLLVVAASSPLIAPFIYTLF